MSAFRQGKVPPAKKEQMTDPAVTDKLISNLKQQVACLELELKYVKEKGNEVKPPPQNAVVSTSTEFRATHGDVLRRASELEAEVFRLKERFAEREKEHALEVAQLRGSIEVGGLTRAQGHAQTLRGELERRTTEFTTEIASQKERHVQEVVALQKTVERLEADKASHETELLSVLKEKNALVNELLQLRDTLRSTQSSLEGSERQRNELSQMLSSEQEKRRQLEIQDRDLRTSYSAGHQETVKGLEARVADLEARLKDTAAQLHNKSYECEQLKLVDAKQKEDIRSMSQEKAASEQREELMKTAVEAAKETARKSAAALADVESERDYYHLSTDRLKVENSVLEVKLGQSEAKGNADRAALINLEKQYCAALENIEALKRELRRKEDVYKSLDDHDNELRRTHRAISEELAVLKVSNEDVRHKMEETTKRYEECKQLADMGRTEQQITQALSKFDKAKQEMQHLLDAQMRLSHDLSTTMYELPDSSTVLRVLSPAAAVIRTAVRPGDISAVKLENDTVVLESTESVPKPVTQQSIPADQPKPAISSVRQEILEIQERMKQQEERLKAASASQSADQPK